VEARSGLTYQFSNIVLGLEWDIDWAGNNDTTNSGIGIPGIGPIQVSSNNGRITTLAARFGSDVRQLALLGQSWRRLGRQQQRDYYQRDDRRFGRHSR
jgi:hypothetical protein